MVSPNPATRPTCKKILNDFLINDGALEKKCLRLQAKKLTGEMKNLENMLNIKRKNSS
jgi:hypothetical protein